MNSLIEIVNLPGLECSRVARIGRTLVAFGLGVKVMNGALLMALMLGLGLMSASAQTPSGTFFNGNSSQLGNSFRSVTFFFNPL